LREWTGDELAAGGVGVFSTALVLSADVRSFAPVSLALRMTTQIEAKFLAENRELRTRN
jgi:uncharacterized protein involved in response to NO